MNLSDLLGRWIALSLRARIGALGAGVALLALGGWFAFSKPSCAVRNDVVARVAV